MYSINYGFNSIKFAKDFKQTDQQEGNVYFPKGIPR